MTRRVLTTAALLALLLNVSGAAALAHEGAHEQTGRHDLAGHGDADCAVCQAVAAARTAAPPPPAPSVVTASPTPRRIVHVAAPTPHARDLPASLTARGPPAAA